MSASRSEIIADINAQRRTIREHIEKYEKFKSNGDHTSSAESTIQDAQRMIADYMGKKNANGIDSDPVDHWRP